MKTCYFEYGSEATDYLKARDQKLAKAIDAVGHVYRERNPDLFSAVVENIIAQQVSTQAAKTVNARVVELVGAIDPDALLAASKDALQKCGMTLKKVDYIQDFALKVKNKELNLSSLETMNDLDAIKALSSLKGIGEWTAEMLLLFSLNRMDIFSYKDIGIHRGVRMVYHHREVTKQMWEKYRKRFSPYGSVASLYFWAISHRDVPGYDHDYALPKK